MASLTQWTWVWVDSRSWWWTGRPGILWFMGSWRVGHDWVTELNWTDVNLDHLIKVVSVKFCHCKISTFHTLFFEGESLCCTAEITTINYQLSSVTQSCLTLCDPKDCSRPSLPVHHQLPEFTQTLDHGVGDAIQPSHPLSSPSPPAFNLSQHQSLFQC